MLKLENQSQIWIEQKHELAEFFGFESRNKYEIKTDKGELLAYACENQRGILGFIFRQFFGHWRTFEIHLYSPTRELILTAKHPFRFFFQRLEIFNNQGQMLGALQQHFSLLSKRFDLCDGADNTIMQVDSPLWKLWAFQFLKDGREMATIHKKWSGIMSEFLTDKDRFLLTFSDLNLDDKTKTMLVVAALFIDLQYFEMKANH